MLHFRNSSVICSGSSRVVLARVVNRNQVVLPDVGCSLCNEVTESRDCDSVCISSLLNLLTGSQ